VILLRNADVYALEPLGVRHLLIAGERVVWLGRDLPPLPPALGVEEQDLDRRRVIPGLIDGHVHVTGGGGEAGPHPACLPSPFPRSPGPG
jgi:beta-aspartyl-dipeptidase (metallo-type)